jgi:hypothetical protein
VLLRDRRKETLIVKHKGRESLTFFHRFHFASRVPYYGSTFSAPARLPAIDGSEGRGSLVKG